ncbi:hypothetical protein [Weissella cibaria]|uniref:hypothetical protein n=1 Tax=Weissella cibaria TaxID=137591 RepID=UPI00106ED341|nr:hypothetical protein [Weissella cibaria]
MKNKVLLSATLLSIPVSLFGFFDNSISANSNSNKSEMKMSGSIVGDYNSKDKTVVGATLPGKDVTFTVPMTKTNKTYLHFAFMHAASGDKGWYFAPKSSDGVELNNKSMKSDSTKDITNKISLYAAPDKDTVNKVKENDGKLKFEPTDKYLSAKVKVKDDQYVVKIKNMSKKDYKTPFSSGVWQVSSTKNEGFDHKPSKQLSELATSGHRDDLLQLVNQNK